MTKELVMYSRTSGCPFISIARRVLEEESVQYREIYIDQDITARQRVLDWTGFLSVPTLIVTEPGDDLPHSEPAPLERGRSPRGINRGAMITEPSADELKAWLKDNNLL